MTGELNKPNTDRRTRASIARWLNVLTMALLLCAGLFLVYAWWSAWQQGDIPATWGDFPGNHGPWRHIGNLRASLTLALMMPLCAMVPAVLSLLINPTGKALALAAISFATFMLLISTHYWLID
jgi:hypothetical protein